MTLVKYWERVHKTKDCWLWTGAKWTNGYGMIRIGNKQVHAHRVFFEQLVGPIPEGMILDHLCRTKSCVNPEHLEPVTIKTNTLRGLGPTAQNSIKTHCKYGHPLAGSNLRLVQRGERECRTCKKERDVASRPRRRDYWREYKRKCTAKEKENIHGSAHLHR